METGPSPRPRIPPSAEDWWTIYQNTELNDLEQRCANANQNIAAALHAYEQAHDLVRENKASLYPTVSIGAAATRNRISDNQAAARAGHRYELLGFPDSAQHLLGAGLLGRYPQAD